MENIANLLTEYLYFKTLDLYGAPLLAVFFIFLFTIEGIRKLRDRKENRWKRIKTNAGVAITAMLALRLALIPALVFFAKWSEMNGIGLLNWIDVPLWLGFFIAFLLLDYGNYLWHLLNHKINFLWRFHNVHHIDLDLDITTALRFHFGEILFSVLFRGLMILFIGPPFLLVLIYEIFFEAATLFHHSNWRISFRVEKLISWFIVTPRMHGVHHSIVQRETNSNYSVIFNWWDRMHRSIRLNIPQDHIDIGVPSYRSADEQKIKTLLLMPWKKPRPWQLPDGKIPERESKSQKPKNHLVP